MDSSISTISPSSSTLPQNPVKRAVTSKKSSRKSTKLTAAVAKKKVASSAIVTSSSSTTAPLPISTQQGRHEEATWAAPEAICDGRCLAERRVHCRELGKWGRQMLTLVGLENVFQRALGSGHWRRYSRAVKDSIANPVDFCASPADNQQFHCNWCLGQRDGATGHEFCPTMNGTLLNGMGMMANGSTGGGIGANGGGGNSPMASSFSPGSSAGSSTASSPTNAPAILQPASKLFPSFLFNASAAAAAALHSKMLKNTTTNNNNGGHSTTAAAAQSLLCQSTSSTFSQPPGVSPSPPSSKSAAPRQNGAHPTSAVATAHHDSSPFGRLFPLQQNAVHHQQNQHHHQHGQQLSPGAAERMAMATAMQQLMATTTANGGGDNIAAGGGGASLASAAALAAAFLPSLFPTTGLYPACWSFPGIMGQHFAAAFANQHNGPIKNGNSGANPSSPPTPTAEIDFHQQLALAWQSQMLAAFGLIGSLNGFGTSAAKGGEHQQPQLTTSEDEALAFLLGRRQKVPTENGKKKGGGEEEEPLDLSAKPSAKVKQQSKERGTKRPATGKMIGEEAPKLIKNESPDSLQAFEEEFDALEELVEDGSEAESPKLGTKKSYTQADLDAAVLAIRSGELGTRKASVHYGIPRSTLRNKIYKLEAAEDTIGGDGACKRRRMTAFAMHKRGQRLVAAAMQKRQQQPNAMDEEDVGMAEAGGDQSDDGQPSSAVPSPIPEDVPLAPMTEGAFATTAEKLFKQLSGQIGEFVGQFQQQQPKREKLTTAGKDGVKNGCGDEMVVVANGKMEKAQSPPKSAEPMGGINGRDKAQRPKRGQYRRYDKDALDRAVAAVRLGQMSVHRAGSHFGVPHSTLEYKVKERNLLRTKSKRQLLSLHSSSAIPRNQSPSIIKEAATSLTSSPVADVPNSPVTQEVRCMLGTMLDSILHDGNV